MSDARQDFDILIVGSGPSGVQAALECVRAGLRTALVDIGYTDETYEKIIPAKSFVEIRRSDENQREYFLGQNIEKENLPSAKAARSGSPDSPPEREFREARAGIHLTPPRRHMVRDSENLLPLKESGFYALQSTSLGGLGAGWGANAFALEDWELREIGIPPEEIRPFYQSVSRDIGLSGNIKSDTSPLVALGLEVQPPLPLDSNAESILSRYQKISAPLRKAGFLMGQSLLAVLSRPLGTRQANPLHDMDFWSNEGKSVYRPRYTLEEIKASEHSHLFTHLRGRLVMRFEEHDAGVSIETKDVHSGDAGMLHAKKLLLAAGAIGSARIALQSFGDYTHRTPILSNHNIWIASLNLSMLGKPARDKRHSLSQLTGLLRTPELNKDYVLAQFYSYRSLLLYRLLENLPLPPRLGVYFLRLVLTSLTMINVHFGDQPNPERFLKLSRKDGADTLEIQASFSKEEKTFFRRYERKLKIFLRKLRLLPLATTRPMHGASIHYAGTLPYSQEEKPFTTDARGKLRGTKNVFVADGSSWRSLPAKGLTLTLMANARRIAHYAAEEIKAV